MPEPAAPSSPDGVEGPARGRFGRRSMIGLGASLGIAAITGTALAAGEIRQSATVLDPAVRLDPPERPEPLAPGAYDPFVRYVALYGYPGSPTLGALGDQGVEASVARIRSVAQAYVGLGRPVVPAFEILASVASEFAGPDGDYSNEFAPSTFQPWIDAAAANGFHVVFDLQSGRSRFPNQAREYEVLIRQPNVSLALDPEWRVGPTQRPGGGRVGTVDASEVNETIDYVDSIIRAHGLPRKMLIVHQFTPSMITNKQQIRGTDKVQVVLHMDGFGSLTLKRGSYARVVADLPAGAVTGWKNFFSEDRPTPTAAQTLDNVPQPIFVSYQ